MGGWRKHPVRGNKERKCVGSVCAGETRKGTTFEIYINKITN